MPFYYLFLTELKAQLRDEQLKKLSDASSDPIRHSSDTSAQVTYKTALQQWKTIAHINKWIKENFRYEIDRAKQLAENSPERENGKDGETEAEMIEAAILSAGKKSNCFRWCIWLFYKVDMIRFLC